MTNATAAKKLNAREILEKLTEIRKRLPEIVDLPHTSRAVRCSPTACRRRPKRISNTPQ
jgi:hypothetical protein